MRPGRERGDCAAPLPNIVHYLTTLDTHWTGRKLGFTCHTGDLSWDELIAWVQEAERLGYSAFCTTEESGKDAFAVLAVLARETKTISLGTAIVNFYSRTPTLLAMSARSIHDLSGGRFGPFGLGAGGIGFMQRGHGIVVEKPLARAKETVAIVRGLLTQKKFSYDGQWFKPNDFHLREGPIGEAAPPIWLAGLGPKMVGTAWEERDFDRATGLVSDELLDKFCLVGTPEKNAERIQWLFANGVYPIIYPLPRRERMVEDHHSVLEQASRWAQVMEAASPDH
ncbi:MAG: LLM class flavin-dependent oxidoreductase [Chloroflexi bacterium]|nr:MAG: LLM class flavin-dependent oxidoreductase [Chloroflexota bacterium]